MTNRMRRMMRYCTMVWLTVLCCAVTVAAQSTEWKSYSYPAEGFQVSYPTLPSVQKKDIDTQAGTVELRSYIADIADVALFIGVCDYGPKTNATDPDTMLQGAKNGALQNSSAHLVSEQKFTLGTHHGLRYEAESDAAHFSARIYLVGNTLYQTLVVFPVGKSYAQTAKFLDSFQLIDRTNN